MVCVFVSARAQTIDIEQDTAAVNCSGANIDARGKKSPERTSLADSQLLGRNQFLIILH